MGKICYVCKKEKDLSEFYKNLTNYDKVTDECKECSKQLRKNYTKNNSDKIRLYRKRNRDKSKNSELLRTYNITLDEYKNMLLKQNNSCEICLKQFTTKRNPCVDHNHSNNKVRGLLCRKCNAIVGMSTESITILQNTIKYIEKYN